MSTQTFAATGLTCGHCVSAVTAELGALPGVQDVRVDLVADGTSTLSVTSKDALSDADVAAALDEAGEYKLVSA